MTVTALFANIGCRDLARSTAWFTRLFGTGPDAEPMDGLVEWHHADCAGLQLFHNPDAAGHGTLTLIVDDLDAERARVADAGLTPGAVENADYTRIVRMRDPDGNLVVLAQPR